MSKSTILLQLDTDPQPSVFDSAVAIDAGCQFLLRHAGVTPEMVRGLVHGAMFTRGGEDLRRTAIFVGGSNVSAGEALVAEIRRVFFGPLRVSVLMDSNGANTTAAAAVLAAQKHLDLGQTAAVVLGGSGPVGQRVVRLLARLGATVGVASRDLQRAKKVCEATAHRSPGAKLSPMAASSLEETRQAIADKQLVIAAGAAGVQVLSADVLTQSSTLQVAIDLNAVPPAGLEGVDMMDKAKLRDRLVCYGAIGVGATKMKIHKAALQKIFESNDQILDAEEVFEIGQGLV